MRAVFLVPRRKDNGHRDRLWAWCRARWERYFPEIAIYEGHHDDGLFNRAAGVNRAAAIADKDGPWDLGIVLDSDVFLTEPAVRDAIALAVETGSVVWPHTRWRELRQDWTERTLVDRRDFGAAWVDRDLDVYVGTTNPISWSCCIVIPRAIWDDMGGFDERFRGWGWEDMAAQSVICGLYPWKRLGADVYNLWHERSPERIVKGQPRSTASEAYVLNARLGRRYMLALRRDHAMHDRPEPADEVERQRDIRNLQLDDAKWSAEAKRHGLPDWDDWWPTLEELRDGAKAHRAGAPLTSPTVTVVVRTGGEPDRWEERSAYLRQSLASLNEQVSGPIVQRVVYSDWDPEYRAQVQAIAAEHGFYVSGPDRHVGYVAAMQQLWGYISRKALGSHILSVEDDFLYDRPVDLVPMIETLADNPHLRQIALLRAPAYPREFEAGGVIESLKSPVELRNHRPHPFLEHRDHFTANPSLWRKSLVSTPWPSGTNTERRFGDAVLRDQTAAFAYWGAGEPWISHIGETKAAHAY